MADGSVSPEVAKSAEKVSLDQGITLQASQKFAEDTRESFQNSADPKERADYASGAALADNIMTYIDLNLPPDDLRGVIAAYSAREMQKLRQSLERTELAEQQAKEADARAATAEQLAEEAVKMSEIDGLTGLKNQKYYEGKFQEDFDRLNMRGELSILFFDTDNFKLINDTLGHPVADEELKRIAELLKKNTRPTDLVVRRSGDEFVVILQDTSPQVAKSKADDINNQLLDTEDLRKAFGDTIEPSLSIGITTNIDENGLKLDRKSILNRAEIAMQKSKATKGTSTIYEPGMTMRQMQAGQR